MEIEARSFEFPADRNDVIGVAASDLAEAADPVKKILERIEREFLGGGASAD